MNDKYTAEQVNTDLRELINEAKARGDYGITFLIPLLEHWADAIDALLRERESAKAAVTDEMIEQACEAFEGPYDWEFQTDNVKANTRAAMRRSIEFVASKLASARVPDRWREDVETLLDAVDSEHGGEHTDADCRHCVAVNRLSAMLVSPKPEKE